MQDGYVIAIHLWIGLTIKILTIINVCFYSCLGIAVSASNSLFWIVGTVVNFLTPVLVSPPFHIYGFLYLISVANLIGACFITLAVVETKVSNMQDKAALTQCISWRYKTNSQKANQICVTMHTCKKVVPVNKDYQTTQLKQQWCEPSVPSSAAVSFLTTTRKH